MTQASRRLRKPRTSQLTEATQSTTIEMVEDDSTPPLESFSQASRTSKVRQLTRHLLYASSNEKDGALKDVLAQKQHLFSKREYCYMLRAANNIIQRSLRCKVVHRANQSHVVQMEATEGNHPSDTTAQAKRGLLSAILMFIFLSKSKKSGVNCVTENVLQNFLSSVGISYDAPDQVFGDIKKLISPSYTAEFIYNGFISFAKSSDRFETQIFTFDWGPRATLVCEPKVILESFCSIIKDFEVDKWEDQLETVKQVEEERQQILQNSEKYMEGEK